MISYGATRIVCEKINSWDQVIDVMLRRRRSQLETDAISYITAISVGEMGKHMEQTSVESR